MTLWAALTLLMVVLSYVFTLLMAAACVCLPLLLFGAWMHVASFVLLLYGIATAAVILWSLPPRRDRFAPPGPELKRAEQPTLFAEIDTLSSTLGEAPPSAVYLLPEVNAWVAEREGWMGIGSRRVMGVGLPLMRVLNTAQFRAVLAHEIAHYYRGDTRLLPFVRHAQTAMARTLATLGSPKFAEAVSHHGLSQLAHTIVFSGISAWWKGFMRVIQAVSRRQEYRADELSCRIAGSGNLVNGLCRLNEAEAAITPFYATELLPALSAGIRPPIADGFAHYLSVPEIAAAAAASLDGVLKQDRGDPYDSHPPLRDRIAAARSISPSVHPECSAATRPAIEWLVDIERLEAELLMCLGVSEQGAQLRVLAWDQIGSEVYVPMWRDAVQQCGTALNAYRVAALPEAVSSLSQVAARIPDPEGMLLTREERSERASQLLVRALALAAYEEGWQLRAEPGEFELRRDQHRLAPAKVVADLRSGAMSAEAWRGWATAAGIAKRRLAPQGRANSA